MSLFTVCNWWSSQCSDLDENYDVASLLCARFGLEESEKDYVVVGSHSGHLSIFYPNVDAEQNVNGNSFKPTDLLLETLFSNPILGIYSGKFNSHLRSENANQLAVLHPNSLAIFNLHIVGGVAEHGIQLSLQPLAEYKFERMAFAFCKGHFGQVKGREFFCIVHLDGTLTFYEQDGISYECQFPGHRALPSPVIYCERTDSFFRLGSAWTLECYTYQDLAHSSINNAVYQPVWEVCLGEGVIDMCVVQAREDSASIMVLGERSFISLSDNGKVEFILKLDYAPKCFHSFVIGYYWEPTARLVTVIISDTAKVFIYENANIIWAAQFKDEAPVAVQRSNLCGLPGGIATLGANGQLRIGYLGSDPYVFKVPPLNVEVLSFNQAQKELMQLEEEIKEAVDIRDMDAINRSAAETVRVHFYIDDEITEDSDTLLLDVPADVAVKELPSCTGGIKLKCKTDLAELQIAFNAPEGIKCSQETLTYVDVVSGMTVSLPLEFYIAELLYVHTTRIDAVVSYITTKGIPRVIQNSAHLPLKMFFKSKQPQKTAALKITFNVTTKALTPKLSTFFSEFVTWESDVQALGLSLLCPGAGKTEEIVTIVAAKNSNRFRIQSDSLEALPMIIERLVRISAEQDKQEETVKGPTKKSGQKDKMNKRTRYLLAAPTIPAQQILHKIDVHRETQENIRKQTTELDALWNQFKDLQRKLQEKAESEPKETLIMQIEENYDQLIAEGDKLMEIRKDEKRQRCDLTCGLTVANWIISHLNLEEKVVRIIAAVLCTPIEDWTELSWEESMSPGIDMLHHFGPLNRAKSAAVPKIMETANLSYELFDYTRFRRHFAALFERIMRLASSEAPPEVPEAQAQEKVPKTVSEISGLTEYLQVHSAPDDRNKAVGKAGLARCATLEAVEDDENEYDEEDLREVGYKKSHGSTEQDANETSEWLNENYELPTSEELFSNLGIWW